MRGIDEHLRGELAGLAPDIRRALRAALDRDGVRLAGGAFGVRDDGEGCLLSLAAWQLGIDDGAALLATSVAAVRVPVVFDELWAALLADCGDAETAEWTARAIVRAALADLDDTVATAADVMVAT